jgi:hypothetical protein
LIELGQVPPASRHRCAQLPQAILPLRLRLTLGRELGQVQRPDRHDLFQQGQLRLVHEPDFVGFDETQQRREVVGAQLERAAQRISRADDRQVEDRVVRESIALAAGVFRRLSLSASSIWPSIFQPSIESGTSRRMSQATSSPSQTSGRISSPRYEGIP